jgi:hypothetical protein
VAAWLEMHLSSRCRGPAFHPGPAAR